MQPNPLLPSTNL